MKETAENREGNLVEANFRKRSLHENCGISSSSDLISINKIGMQDNLVEINKSQAPVVGALETGSEAAQTFAEVKSAMEKKTNFRRRMEHQQFDSSDQEFDSSEISRQSQTDELPEEAVLNCTYQMNTMSTLTPSDEANTEGKVDLFDGKETKEVPLAIIRPPVSHLKKKLLILDLNGLLADIVFSPPKNCKADAHIAGRAIFWRPFCDDFLRFCFDRFEVCIWSSRIRKNVEKIIDILMGDMKSKLLFCWDASQCTATKFNTPGYRYKPLAFKELKKIWEKNCSDLPWEKGYYNESNTLLIDDSPCKAVLNPPYTAIFPYSFKYDRDDNALGLEGDLRVYLERLASAENVQNFVEQNPFGQEPITEQSKEWSFYSHVISTCAAADLQHNPGLRA